MNLANFINTPLTPRNQNPIPTKFSSNVKHKTVHNSKRNSLLTLDVNVNGSRNEMENNFKNVSSERNIEHKNQSTKIISNYNAYFDKSNIYKSI